MRLSTGDKLGPYEITGLIGKGGMGEVYRANDTRLNRPVAIKVSSREFNDRFEREAQAISALNHPNICTLYDIGPNYLVMEFVEGELLSKMIERGPLPLDKALGHAVQIVDALAAAHAKGVIHRDLKPANIIITKNGVKVLDFGLARLKSERLPSAAADNIETVTDPITRAGAILGTLYYMAPEQGEAKEADERSDIFSFGTVFYEMITGERPFTGDTQAAVLASLMKDQPPPMNQRQPATPRALERAVRRCMEKKPEDRWRSAHDLKPALELIDLDAPVSLSSASASVPIPVEEPAPTRRKWLWPAIGTAAAIAAVVVVLWASWRSGPAALPVRFEIPSTEKLTFITGSMPKVSPNGRWVVFPGSGSDKVVRLWIRALDSVEVRPLPGTETPNALPPPVFWSPDSRFIAFSATLGPFAPGQLKKLDISGGPAQTICDVTVPVVAGTWNRDGVIVFALAPNGASERHLMRVAAAGGVATAVTEAPAPQGRHWHPEFLPDGRHFLYFQIVRSRQDLTGIYVGSIDAKPGDQSTTRILASDRQASYSAGSGGALGYLMYVRDTTLVAQPFDLKRLGLSGEPVPVADQVGSFAALNAGLFSLSETGVLAYYAAGAGGSLSQLTWFDEQGKVIGTVGERGRYANPAVSPDGARIAVSQPGQVGTSNIWVFDTTRGTSTRLTFNAGRDDFPVWSPDGKSIAFSSSHGGHMDLYQKLADGSGEERLLLNSDEDKRPTSWSRDGRFLLYMQTDAKTASDIWILALEAAGAKPTVFLQTPFRERFARISPDGRWVAYESNESGNGEIYVRPFSPNGAQDSAAGGKWMISKGGGTNPGWSGDGKKLFYVLESGTQQMAVDVSGDKTFQAGKPRSLFSTAGTFTMPDVSADGKRFLFATWEGQNAQPPMTVVLNWQAGLRK